MNAFSFGGGTHPSGARRAHAPVVSTRAGQSPGGGTTDGEKPYKMGTRRCAMSA
jgi:hypothetical protein